ncbi:sulfatase [Chthonobacter rhizosphaerae]|uniref:sulfatase n=1 Tax=Chthonobacter rhizosphaerae TaxID=2735553 RepID=UPI0015EF57A1|nr:sulfatase [Chthonobacter rhizosphaerae]
MAGEGVSDQREGRAGRTAGEPASTSSTVVTVLAITVLMAALLLPDAVEHITPAAFLRLPLELVLLVLALAVLPTRLGRLLVPVAGLLVGLAAIAGLADIGTRMAFARPFDAVLDWHLLPSAMHLLAGTLGPVGAWIGAAVAALLSVALLGLGVWAVRRLARLVARSPRRAALGALSLAALWSVLSFSGAAIDPRLPIAAADASRSTVERIARASASLADMEAFEGIAAIDAFRTVPADQLLAGLHGKDVLLVFVESYGRDALENPLFAPNVTALLAAGDSRLAKAGVGVRSAFLTSPTVGGQSWLAHGTVLSGLWIGNQQRYDSLVAGDRFTLVDAFSKAGWRTVAVMPAIVRPWPEGETFGYEAIYAAKDLGYRGRPFDWVTMPDQYTLATLHDRERTLGPRRPVMAEVALISSHAPWTPVPRLVPWPEVGDGTIFDPMTLEGDPPEVVWRDTGRVRTQYRLALEYTLSTILSYVETFGGEDLVTIVVGDHQPAPLVTGEGATRDVPIHILASDPAVLNRIADWGFAETLVPPPDAPVWRMDALRDRLLAAFDADYAPAVTSAPHPAVPGLSVD